ncbi:hypothetical protein OS493_028074, partial [Desmophyllum pertusum]
LPRGNANSRTYNDGDTIIYHNVTSPVDQATCTSCSCSNGGITDCNSYHCDVGFAGPIEACDNWITGEEGVCCPRCNCNEGDTWLSMSAP